MDFDATAIAAWARRDEAENVLRYFLNELAQPSLSIIRDRFGASAQDETAAALRMRGQSAVIVPWRNRMHLKYLLPAGADEERLRIQFLAAENKPYFTVEARYEHPKESLEGDPALAEAQRFLDEHGFARGNDGYGYFWAYVLDASEWLQGAKTLDRLLEVVGDSVELLAQSGLVEALGQRTPVTPPSEAPEVDA